MRIRTSRVAALAASVVAPALLAVSVLAPVAYADGDPASDVLATQGLFLSSDANVPVRQQLQLAAMLKQTVHEGYPLRVAIVGSPSDLGSISSLWRRPQTYARFLGSELKLVFHGTVLVVMPNGYGTDVTASGTRTASGEAELPLPGQHLGSAAIAAVEKLASSADAPVAAPAVRAPTVTGHTPILPWLVFVVGFLPLILAWGLSLRRQPLRLHTRRG
jgi:hypothetical protein